MGVRDRAQERDIARALAAMDIDATIGAKALNDHAARVAALDIAAARQQSSLHLSPLLAWEHVAPRKQNAKNSLS